MSGAYSNGGQYQNSRQQRQGSREGYRIERGVQEHTLPPRRRVQTESMDELQRLVSGIGGAALLFFGLRQSNYASRIPLAALGAGLIYQGASGRNFLDFVPVVNDMPAVQQMTMQEPAELRIRKTMTVNRPASELYTFWRKLENLPRFMTHIKSIQELDEKRSHWVANVIKGVELEWDAEITVDKPNEMIAWQTLPEAMVQNRGYVKFIPVHRGTEVSVSIEYDPPAGGLGKIAGRMAKFIAEHDVQEELRSFKRLMEVGEIITTEGQPSGRREAWDAEPAQRGYAEGF